MLPSELQFGSAARVSHPLLSIVAGSEVHEVREITKLAHACSITALAQYVADGRHGIVRCTGGIEVKHCSAFAVLQRAAALCYLSPAFQC
jgi:hypothetical protein